LRDVWIRTQSAAVASWRATDLATHPSQLATHPSPINAIIPTCFHLNREKQMTMTTSHQRNILKIRKPGEVLFLQKLSVSVQTFEFDLVTQSF
jgi:hypothetical protein